MVGHNPGTNRLEFGGNPHLDPQQEFFFEGILSLRYVKLNKLKAALARSSALQMLLFYFVIIIIVVVIITIIIFISRLPERPEAH